MLEHLLENDIRKWAEDYLATLVEGAPTRASARRDTRSVRRALGKWAFGVPLGQVALSSNQPVIASHRTSFNALSLLAMTIPSTRLTREPRLRALAWGREAAAGPAYPTCFFRNASVRGPGERGARRVVALPLVAIEAVVGGIDVDLDVRMGGGDLFDPGDRDVRVLLAEMEERRDLRLQVLLPDDPAAVIADRGAEARKLRRPPTRRPCRRGNSRRCRPCRLPWRPRSPRRRRAAPARGRACRRSPCRALSPQRHSRSRTWARYARKWPGRPRDSLRRRTGP